MTWLLDGRPLRKILVSRLRYLGDVVMSTVVLDVLRAGDPGVGLGFLAEFPHGIILAEHDSLDQLHLLDVTRRGADAQARASSSPVAASTASAHGFAATVSRLRKADYDLAVDLFFNPRSAWLLRLSGLKFRICGTTGSRRWFYSHRGLKTDLGEWAEPFLQRAPGGLGDHLSRLLPLQHGETGQSFARWFVEHYPLRPVLPRLSAPVLGDGVRELFQHHQLDPAQPFVLAVPGATWASKEWPLSNWQALLTMAAEEKLGPVVMVTPPRFLQPWEQLDTLLQATGGFRLPPLGLAELAAVVGACGLYLGVDGGLMHLAVGLARPTVALFGPTRPEIWFPYEKGGPFRVLGTWPDCAPCHRHDCNEFICLPRLAASGVLEEALTLWNDFSVGNPTAPKDV